MGPAGHLGWEAFGEREAGLWTYLGAPEAGLGAEPQLGEVKAKHGGERRGAVTGGAGQDGCGQRSHVLSGLAEHTRPGTLPHAL